MKLEWVCPGRGDSIPSGATGVSKERIAVGIFLESTTRLMILGENLWLIKNATPDEVSPCAAWPTLEPAAPM